MGAFKIVIQGIGAHHNLQNESDANRMAAQFVQTLRSAGHTVEAASFMADGGVDADDIADPSAYLSARTEQEQAGTPLPADAADEEPDEAEPSDSADQG